MERKMIVTDLDGTLLKGDKSISELTCKIMKKTRDSGHKFVIATARPLRAANKFLEVLDIDAGIYHNGALINIAGKKIDSFQIENPKAVIDEISGKYPNSNIAVESDDVLYSNFDAERLWPGNGYVFTETNFTEIEGKSADKIIIEVTSYDDMKKYEECLNDDLYIQLSENNIGMIMKKKATKSNAIKYIADLFDIEMENVIAFGDDYNDIDMLLSCGTGICVKNGVEEVQKNADIICDTNENDGVAKWIECNILNANEESC
jgi:Cof subfamily protein (haloacid dehalogenase superfamily)